LPVGFSLIMVHAPIGGPTFGDRLFFEFIKTLQPKPHFGYAGWSDFAAQSWCVAEDMIIEWHESKPSRFGASMTSGVLVIP
jgi:hypothetical protein